MAPVCMGCCLQALLQLGFAVLLLCFLCQDISARLVYDCQALLDIRAFEEELLKHDLGDHTSGLLPPLASVPAYLHCSPAVISWRKGSRRCEKRAGVLVRLKILRRSACWIDPHHLFRGCHASQRPLCLCWIQLVVPSHLAIGFP